MYFLSSWSRSILTNLKTKNRAHNWSPAIAFREPGTWSYLGLFPFELDLLLHNCCYTIAAISNKKEVHPIRAALITIILCFLHDCQKRALKKSHEAKTIKNGFFTDLLIIHSKCLHFQFQTGCCSMTFFVSAMTEKNKNNFITIHRLWSASTKIWNADWSFFSFLRALFFYRIRL